MKRLARRCGRAAGSRSSALMHIIPRSGAKKRLVFTALIVLAALLLSVRIASSVRLRLFRHNKSVVGIASFYAGDFHGKQTASGEIFNMRRCSAAHRTLPFNTFVRVTNMSNGRRLIVKINDRGPFVSGRIIDLSYGAAKRLGFVQDGITKVKLEYYLPG